MNKRYHKFALTFSLCSFLVFFFSLWGIKSVVSDQKGLKAHNTSSLKITRAKKIVKKQNTEKKKRQKRRQRKMKSLKPIVSSNLVGQGFGLDIKDSLSSMLDQDLLSVDENVVMDENSVDEKPRVIHRGAIEFPENAIQDDVNRGIVELRMLIDKNGKVSMPEILKANPTGYFEDAALAMVQGWTFRPATFRGRPVAIWAKQVVRFGE